ncbi:hypothetical protein NA57DRAFT_78186 [Rhizodiscina lignyota]|uniref:RING-type domain-containing protein n=1 Tax=Rhizodiscina lignyota TaxID=1504668 RepID=A0A9P4M6Q9_9PEZI|nr:hypothetical protein NA57DRAFT_78186 [Rhizodiscina lignyota]
MDRGRILKLALRAEIDRAHQSLATSEISKARERLRHVKDPRPVPDSARATHSQSTTNLTTPTTDDTHTRALILHEEKLAIEDREIAFALTDADTGYEHWLRAQSIIDNDDDDDDDDRSSMMATSAASTREETPISTLTSQTSNCRPSHSSEGQCGDSLDKYLKEIGQEWLFRECAFCFQQAAFFEMITLDCGHSVCKRCILGAFDGSLIDDGLFPPRCCSPIQLWMAADFLDLGYICLYMKRCEEEGVAGKLLALTQQEPRPRKSLFN